VSGVPIAVMRTLMSESLAAWGVAGRAEQVGDCAIIITGEKQIRIKPAPADSMFRWLVTVDGRARPALSLLAVLRQVRHALDPDYAESRLRIAVTPLAPS